MNIFIHIKFLLLPSWHKWNNLVTKVYNFATLWGWRQDILDIPVVGNWTALSCKALKFYMWTDILRDTNSAAGVGYSLGTLSCFRVLNYTCVCSKEN